MSSVHMYVCVLICVYVYVGPLSIFDFLEAQSH